MKNKKFLIPFFIILIILPISIIKSQTVISNSGTWDTATYPNFTQDNRITQTNTNGEINYTFGNINTTINKSGGIQLGMFLNSLQGERYNWFWTDGVKRVEFYLTVKNGNETAKAHIYLADDNNILLDSSQILLGTHNSDPYAFTAGHINNNGGLYIAQIIRDNSTDNRSAVFYLSSLVGGLSQNTPWLWNQTAQVVFSENFTVTDNFWINPEVELSIRHEGNGYFNVTFTNLLIESDNMQIVQPTETNTGILPDIYNTLTSLWRIIITSITIILAVIQIAAGVLELILPYLPWVFVAIIIWRVYLCVKIWSLEPLITLGIQLKDITFQLYNYLIVVATAIWNALTFWIP